MNLGRIQTGKRMSGDWFPMEGGRGEGRSRCRAEACCDFLWGKGGRGGKFLGARTVSGLLDTAPWLAQRRAGTNFPTRPIPLRPLGPARTHASQPPPATSPTATRAPTAQVSVSRLAQFPRADLLRALPSGHTAHCPPPDSVIHRATGWPNELLAFARGYAMRQLKPPRSLAFGSVSL